MCMDVDCVTDVFSQEQGSHGVSTTAATLLCCCVSYALVGLMLVMPDHLNRVLHDHIICHMYECPAGGRSRCDTADVCIRDVCMNDAGLLFVRVILFCFSVRAQEQEQSASCHVLQLC